MREFRLKERVEELSNQLEEFESQEDSRGQNGSKICLLVKAVAWARFCRVS